MPTFRTASRLVSILLAAGIAGVGLWFAAGPTATERADALRSSQVRAGSEDREHTVAALHAANPEFDLMWRLFMVLAACDHALAEPEEASRWLAIADELFMDTVAAADTRGQRHFLLSYADDRPWVRPEAGSLFVDGEIALMIAARRAVRDEPWLGAAGEHWTARVEQDLALASDGFPESYPDEAWAFCMTSALLALRLHDHASGTDHSATIRHWTHRLATDGVDPSTQLIGSDWRSDGTALDGTEGSSIWWVSTGLLLLDLDLAAAQYEGARTELIGGLPSLAWSREWPGTAQASDIDSGPVVPFFEASPAASGFALVAARAHGDQTTTRRLERALRAADALLILDPRLANMAEAPMGDAIVLLGLGFGPLWEHVGPMASSGPTARRPTAR